MQIKSAPLTDLVRIFGMRFVEDRCIQIASSLTFTTLLALVPIITVALTMVSAFPVFESWIHHLQRFLMNNIVPESVSSITTYAAEFSANATQLTTVGIAFIVLTALMLMVTIDSAFNVIWRASRPRHLLQRVLVYWMVLTVGPLFVGASLSLTSYMIRLSLGLIDNPPGVGILLFRFTSLALTAIALALLYWTVPNRPVLKRDALVGGLAAGVCLEAMKQGFSFYVAHFATYELVYGAFAAIPVFLLWIYLSWLIVIGGAVLAALLPEWRERAGQSQPKPGSDFFDALQVLKVLWRAHQAGTLVSLSSLHPAVRVRIDHLERILLTLSGAGWVARCGPNGWILARDASAIKVEDIYRLFVFNTDAHVPARHASAELDSLVYDISTRIGSHLQMSLEQLFAQTESGTAPAAPARLTAV
jgi:membrane protein